MRRSAGWLALILSFCCALSGAAEGRGRAAASGKGKKLTASGRGERGRSGKRGGRRKRPPTPPPMPSHLEVTSIEPKSGSVRVALVMPGAGRLPETRLFVLTDERGRRFVPATAECTSPGGSADTKASATGEGTPPVPVHWQCDLSIPPLYRRAALTGVAMEWGDRVVSALPGQVRARWAEGPTSRPVPPPVEKNPTEANPPSPSGEPEPSPPPASGEDDEESEDE